MVEEYLEEPQQIATFRTWITSNGGTIHPNIHFQQVGSGFSVIAKGKIEPDATVISCPLSLIITEDLSRNAIASVLTEKGVQTTDDSPFWKWSERQVLCVYICLHFLLPGENTILKHHPYINVLPAASKLRTSLHFTPSELELFKGSNLYGATLDRKNEWAEEHERCKAFLVSCVPSWDEEFTLERYVTAATYLSSRAFPSTLLGETPSLTSTPESYPILLPGVDAFNHARAQPVSWVISRPGTDGTPTISLVLHSPSGPGQELFNNYGPKPNAELILGYGFTLPNNPDDTIALKIGGSPSVSRNPGGGRWEVGREARGVEPLWDDVLAALRTSGEDEENTEDDPEEDLYGAQSLAGMATTLAMRLPHGNAGKDKEDVRPQVATMLEHYVEGQRAILQSIVDFAHEKYRVVLEALEGEQSAIVEGEGGEEE